LQLKTPAKRVGFVSICRQDDVGASDGSDSDEFGSDWLKVCKRYDPALREVVDFAKQIPGFDSLAQGDQFTLLKSGAFEVNGMLFVAYYFHA